jgi:hypothetical protein
MRHRKTEDTMFLLGGALLGAAAMYLLDPESGRRRREHLAETTGDALGRAGEAVGPAWDTLRERAADLGGRLSDSASAFGVSAADTARDYRDSAWSSARGYAARARGMLPWHEESESHAGAYTAAGITAAALGAGAIYFFDSTNGRTRRKMALDQVNRVMNETSRCMRQTGRYVNDIMNRSRGLAYETRTRFTGAAGEVSPETLMQRVRSEMGHVVTNAGAISVMVNFNRDVTLTGRVLASELDALLTTINKVPGVNQIINRLDVQETPEAVAGGDAGTTAGQRL